MDIWYAVVPLVGALVFIVGWFCFTTWVGIRYIAVERIVEEKRGLTVLSRATLLVAGVSAIFMALALCIGRRSGVGGSLAGVVVGVIFLAAALLYLWAARGSTRLSLQGHLILNVKLRRMYAADEVMRNAELAARVRRRVEERLTFHEARLRRRNLRIDEVLDRVCPTVGESDE